MGSHKEALGVTDATDAYQKYVGSKPLLDTGLMGTAGTALGYYGSNLALAPLVSTLAAATGASPEKVENVRKMISRYGGMLGGLGGLAYGASKHMDTGSGVKGALQSMMGGDYWKDNPEASSRKHRKLLDAITSGRKFIRTPDLLKELLPQSLQEAVPTQEQLAMQEMRRREMERIMQQNRLRQVRGNLLKQQSYADPFAHASVPLDYAMSVIAEDPFLSIGKKTVTNGILQAGTEDGNLTGPTIMNGALRFGAAAIPAYMLGKTVANIFSLPQREVEALSGIGGIAAGIMNTGIFGD